jgi:hypothetical protein
VNESNVIALLERRLSSPEVVPQQWYRRNHVNYELLSYLNHILALRLSGNNETMALFVTRATDFISSSTKNQHLTPEFKSLAHEYLQTISRSYSLNTADQNVAPNVHSTNGKKKRDT